MLSFRALAQMFVEVSLTSTGFVDGVASPLRNGFWEHRFEVGFFRPFIL
jgi:hypothetical protein